MKRSSIQRKTPLKPRKKPLRTNRRTPRRRAELRADGEWALNAKHRRKWRCEVCGIAAPVLHAHHFRPKGSFPQLRYDRRNAVVLCPRHHIFDAPMSAHKDGAAFGKWFQGHRPDDYAYLMTFKEQEPCRRTTQDLLDIAHSFELDNKLYESMAA